MWLLACMLTCIKGSEAALDFAVDQGANIGHQSISCDMNLHPYLVRRARLLLGEKEASSLRNLRRRRVAIESSL